MFKGHVVLLSTALVLLASDARAQSADGAGQALKDITTWGVFGQEESEVVVHSLIAQSTTFPLSSGAGGLSWMFDPAIGTFKRRSESYGPLFAERPLTSGRHKFSLAMSYQYIPWQSIGGQPLDNYVIEDFDTRRDPTVPPEETFVIYLGSSLKLTTERTTFSAVYGLSNRVDVAVDVPFVRTSVSGANLSYVQFPDTRFSGELTSSGSSSGLGDIQVRTKVLAVSRSGFDLAGSLTLRLPSGDAENLLGVGELQTRIMAIGSLTTGPIASHFNVGYLFGGNGLQLSSGELSFDPGLPTASPSEEFDYTFGADIAVSPWVTVAGDIIGRSLHNSATLELQPFPDRPQDLLLTIEPGTVNVLLGTIGCKILLGGAWLLTGGLVFPLNDNGLKPHVTPIVGLERAF